MFSGFIREFDAIQIFLAGKMVRDVMHHCPEIVENEVASNLLQFIYSFAVFGS